MFSKSIVNQDVVNYEYQSEVQISEKPFECNICNYLVKYKCVLNQHIKVVHNREKSLKCEICQRSFGWASNLNAHTNVLGKKVL